jgi:hypothetical protein
MIIIILCLQPPYSAVNKDFWNEKDVGAVLFAYPLFQALVKPFMQG